MREPSPEPAQGKRAIHLDGPVAFGDRPVIVAHVVVDPAQTRSGDQGERVQFEGPVGLAQRLVEASHGHEQVEVPVMGEGVVGDPVDGDPVFLLRIAPVPFVEVGGIGNRDPALGKALVDPASKPHDLRRPGHVYTRDQLMELMRLVREVPVASHVQDYAVRLVLATHPKTETAAPIANQYLRFGSSPRGAQTLLLGGKVRALAQGRFNVSFDDLQAVAYPSLRHRLILNFEAEAEGIITDQIITQILQDVPRDAQVVTL